MNEGENMQQRNEQGQYYHTKSVKKINSIEKDRSIEYHQQCQTILNLYHSGIPTYIIAFQLDMNEDDVCKIIQSILNNTKPLLASPCSISLLDNKFGSFTSILDLSEHIRVDHIRTSNDDRKSY